MEADKVYRFAIAWGSTTASFDREGEVVATSDVRPTPEQVRRALPRFVGEIDQVPPDYSAIKVDGQRAYDLAREGVAMALKPRRVTIHSAEVVDESDKTSGEGCIEIEVHCGKGVYVRAIVRDLAEALGACGHVSALRRLRVGRFSIDHSIALEKLAEMVQEDGSSEVLLPVETALDDIPALALTTEDAFRLKQGRSIVLLPRQVEALRVRLVPRTVGGQDVSRTVLTTHQGRAQALCELRAGRLNPTRIFHLDQES
jgi:tRNA pseudouridine55 synthase